MTSSINPNNINGAYPVAGQDNNSQGFRDNFTNTKTNFQYAADEITALQNSAVLTANLSNSAPVVNNLLTSTLYNGFLQNMYDKRVSLGTLSGSVGINYSLGSYQQVVTNGSITLGFSNFPVAGGSAVVVLQVTVASTAHTLTLPSAVSLGLQGIQGISGQVITFAQTGVFDFAFQTSDGGTTITVFDLNRPLSYFTNSVTLAGGASTTGNITVGNIISSGTSSRSLDVEIVNYANITSTATYSLSNTSSINVLIANNTGYTATVNMPSTPVNGQICNFAIHGNTVTLVKGTGTVLPTFAGSATVGTGYRYVYRSSNASWYKIG
jgi:hypothetical protein